MDISVVIALFNEKESLRELVSGIMENLEAASLSYEIIMIRNDGSTTPKVAHTAPNNPPVSMPTYVAMFTAKGPGVLSLTAMKFTMDSSGIQPWASTSA